MIFPVVMYRCERWKIHEAEHQRIDAFFLDAIIFFIKFFYFTLFYFTELMLLNCGVGEDSWGSLGQQENQTSQS